MIFSISDTFSGRKQENKLLPWFQKASQSGRGGTSFQNCRPKKWNTVFGVCGKCAIFKGTKKSEIQTRFCPFYASVSSTSKFFVLKFATKTTVCLGPALDVVATLRSTSKTFCSQKEQSVSSLLHVRMYVQVTLQLLWRRFAIDGVLAEMPRSMLNAQALSVRARFEVFILCADVCLHPQIPECSGFCFVDSDCCALVLSSMFYDRKMNSIFCVHLLTFWSNGWKFRNSLPISQTQGRFWGVEKC